MLHEVTPLEQYVIEKGEIFVKREDLYGTYPAPPLSKLRGAKIVIGKLKAEGITKIGVFDTRISKAGQGVAYLCEEMGLKCYAGFPLLKDGIIGKNHKIAEKLGAELIPISPASRTAVCYSQFKKIAEEKGALVLPLGLKFNETKMEIGKVVASMNTEKYGCIVLSVGTGTIMSGIISEAKCFVYGVSCGMSTKRQEVRINSLSPFCKANYKLIEPSYEYYEAADTSACPFQTSPYYDMKAWNWMIKNYEKLPKPVLFWNIGA